MKKELLYTPGPTNIPPQIREALLSPTLSHRGEEFTKVCREISAGLIRLFNTRQRLALFTASGSGAMEGVVSNSLQLGETALVINNGYFGSRWVQLCKARGVAVVEYAPGYGTATDLAHYERLIVENKDIIAVCCQAVETSTGLRNPVADMAKIAKKHGKFFFVDAITAFACEDIDFDRDGFDAMVVGSQKALMLPPGLAIVVYSDALADRIAGVPNRSYYFDLLKEWEALKEARPRFTPAIPLFYALAEGLRFIESYGIDHIVAQVRKISIAFRVAARSIGLDIFPEIPAHGLTVLKAPNGLSGNLIVDVMKKDHGITLANGQNELKGQIFRVGHMGYNDIFDPLRILGGLELTLKELGYDVTFGTSLSAYWQTINQNS